MAKKYEKKGTWGVVYVIDNGDAKPVPFATVRLIKRGEVSNTFVADRITDANGKYDFVADKGNYLIEVSHPEYEPMTYEVEILSAGDVVSQNLELSKKCEKETLGESLRKILPQINSIIFNFRFLISLIALFFNFTPVTLLISTIYVTQILFSLFKKTHYQDFIVNSENNEKIKGVFVRIFDPTQMRQTDVCITDAKGRYTFKVEDGDYLISADKPGLMIDDSKHIFTTTASGNNFIKTSVENGRIELPIYLKSNTSNSNTKFS